MWEKQRCASQSPTSSQDTGVAHGQLSRTVEEYQYQEVACSDTGCASALGPRVTLYRRHSIYAWVSKGLVISVLKWSHLGFAEMISSLLHSECAPRCSILQILACFSKSIILHPNVLVLPNSVILSFPKSCHRYW